MYEWVLNRSLCSADRVAAAAAAEMAPSIWHAWMELHFYKTIVEPMIIICVTKYTQKHILPILFQHADTNINLFLYMHWQLWIKFPTATAIHREISMVASRKMNARHVIVNVDLRVWVCVCRCFRHQFYLNECQMVK